MKRMIACKECAKREVKKYEGEWFKRVMGTAKDDMHCDYCCPLKTIKKGDVCAAESMAPNHIPYFSWEAEYIHVPAERPQWERTVAEITIPKTKVNCYECEYRGSVPGDAHSCCNHPTNKDEIKNKALNVKGDAHGIRSGWFNWPFNFDPVWLLSCDGFTPKK